MAIDGAWKIVTKTPMGEQAFTAQIATAGDRLTGTVTGDLFGSAAIEDGRLEGDKAYWTLRVTSPFALTLRHEATFSGDTVTGEVDTGMFGKSSFSGSRA